MKQTYIVFWRFGVKTRTSDFCCFCFLWSMIQWQILGSWQITPIFKGREIKNGVYKHLCYHQAQERKGGVCSDVSNLIITPESASWLLLIRRELKTTTVQDCVLNSLTAQSNCSAFPKKDTTGKLKLLKPFYFRQSTHAEGIYNGRREIQTIRSDVRLIKFAKKYRKNVHGQSSLQSLNDYSFTVFTCQMLLLSVWLFSFKCLEFNWFHIFLIQKALQILPPEHFLNETGLCILCQVLESTMVAFCELLNTE